MVWVRIRSKQRNLGLEDGRRHHSVKRAPSGEDEDKLKSGLPAFVSQKQFLFLILCNCPSSELWILACRFFSLLSCAYQYRDVMGVSVAKAQCEGDIDTSLNSSIHLESAL